MADIFVSYTGEDKGWADWIGLELERLNHVAWLFDWEVSAGGNVAKWMVDKHDEADHVLCVVSPRYLDKTKRYSEWERLGALLAAVDGRTNFVLPVLIEPSELPTLLAQFKRCNLSGLTEEEARTRIANYLRPAVKPTKADYPGNPTKPSGATKPAAGASTAVSADFPGSSRAISNVPISVPRHFLGRDDDLAAIDGALKDGKGRAAITALHGIRGVGKTTLAAAYAEQHWSRYRATWWIRAETASTMRADLVGLGVQLGWIADDAAEEPAVAFVRQKLRDEGDGILLVYDNANNANQISPYLPNGGPCHIIITSNAPDWSGVAADISVKKWSGETGAEYLLAQVGRQGERDAALALSIVLDGLPLAHEQAAAYCARTGLPLAEYRKRFEAEPARFLDREKDASPGYHNRRTAAKAFLLAIEEASKLHSAADTLITYAALLAPEPIPIYLFSEGRKKFPEFFALSIDEDGLDEAIAALRAFALIDRESIPDERNGSIVTDCIRLHRLVREVAAARNEETLQAQARYDLIRCMAAVFPNDIFRNPSAWPRARRLDPICINLVKDCGASFGDTDVDAAFIISCSASYRQVVLGAYADARPLYERVVSIREKALGPDHPETSTGLSNLGYLLRIMGDLVGARDRLERALAISEKVFGPDHHETVMDMAKLGDLLGEIGDLTRARSLNERALKVREQELGDKHPHVATNLHNLGNVLVRQGDLAGARPLFERALAIYEEVLGSEHPFVAASLLTLGRILHAGKDLRGARPFSERALIIYEMTLGRDHPDTRRSVRYHAMLLHELGLTAEATALRQKYGLTDDDK